MKPTVRTSNAPTLTLKTIVSRASVHQSKAATKKPTSNGGASVFKACGNIRLSPSDGSNLVVDLPAGIFQKLKQDGRLSCREVRGGKICCSGEALPKYPKAGATWCGQTYCS